MRKLLLGCVILLTLSACNKEPTDIGAVPENYDLTAAIDSLPQEKGTNPEQMQDAPYKSIAPNDVKNSLNSQLYKAVEENNQSIVKELLEKGANPNVPYYEIFPPADTDDETPLFVASKQGYVEIMKMLIQAGARVNTSCCVLGYTPLIFAVQNEQVDAVKTLIGAGADINTKGGGDCDSLGETPLIYAIKIGNIEIVQLLLQAGADVNATYDESCGLRKNITALMEAQHAGHIKIVELLKSYGAKE